MFLFAGIEGSDYINATWLHGHHKLQEFVVTQHPDMATRGEFWRMLWDHNAQTIVLLSSLDEEVIWLNKLRGICSVTPIVPRAFS